MDGSSQRLDPRSTDLQSKFRPRSWLTESGLLRFLSNISNYKRYSPARCRFGCGDHLLLTESPAKRKSPSIICYQVRLFKLIPVVANEITVANEINY